MNETTLRVSVEIQKISIFVRYHPKRLDIALGLFYLFTAIDCMRP